MKLIGIRRGLLLWMSGLTAQLTGQTLLSSGDDARAPEKKKIDVVRFTTVPTIDGYLHEEVWKTATVLDGFYQIQPGDNTLPSYPTRVFVGYDKHQLYLGIHAMDDRRQVRATVAKRDDVLSDDYIAIYLDTFDDRQSAYLVMLNPLGIQQDGIYLEGKEPDYSIDIVMTSRGRLTDDGYMVELAIPFRSLRYNKNKPWGLHVLRKLRDEEDSWMPLRREKIQSDKASGNELRAHFLMQAGRLTGLQDIETERVLETIGTLGLSQTGRRSPTVTAERWENRAIRPDAGLTTKLKLTSGSSLDVTVNPDFGEIEADQLQITGNQRYPLFFDEKRPFFLEGIDIFRAPVQTVHTRAVIDPDAAVKFSGKSGRTHFGVLLASDNAPGNFTKEERSDSTLAPLIGENAEIAAVRILRYIGNQSNLGFMLTHYDFPNRHNQSAGIDARINVSRRTLLTVHAIGTTTKRLFYDPKEDRQIYRRGNGIGFKTDLGQNWRYFNLVLAGEGYTPDYRADVGYTQRTDFHRWSVFGRYNSEPRPNSFFISWSFLYTFLVQYNWDGRRQYSYHYPRILLNFKNRSFLNVYFYRDFLRVFEHEFGPVRTAERPGAFVGKDTRHTVYRGITVQAGTAPTKTLSIRGSFDYTWNAMDYDLGAPPKFPRVSPAALADANAPLDPGPGRWLTVTQSIAFQPADALRFTLDYTKSRLVRNDTKRVAFDQNLYSMLAQYYFTRFLFVRLRGDYDTMIARVRGQLLLGWTPGPGTSIYVGYNNSSNYNGYSPFNGRYENGWKRNEQLVFVKLSHLLRYRM